MTLDKERKGEIAYTLLKEVCTENGHLRDLGSSELKKKVGHMAQKIDIPREELLEFAKIIGEDVLDDIRDSLKKEFFK